jgi:hypothetical protein
MEKLQLLGGSFRFLFKVQQVKTQGRQARIKINSYKVILTLQHYILYKY